MISKALQYLSNIRSLVAFLDHFEEEATPLLEGLQSKEYAEIVTNSRTGQAHVQLTLKGTKALLDLEGLNYNG